MSKSRLDPRCREFLDRRPKISLRDPKGGPSNFIAENERRREIEVLRVDGCCIKSSACDYLMLVEEGDAFLIELKGSDVEKALKQINATLDALEQTLRPRGVQVRIVPRKVRVPGLIRSDEEKLRKRLGKRERYRCQGPKMEEILP